MPGPHRSFRKYLIAALMVLIATGVLSFLLHSASSLSDTRASRAYEGFAAIFGLVAVAAASLAVVFSFPQFVTWANALFRLPAMELEFAYGPGTTQPLSRVEANLPANITVDYSSIVFRLTVGNKGNGLLDHGLVNIIAPSTCCVEILDDPLQRHHLVPAPVDWSPANKLSDDPDFVVVTRCPEMCIHCETRALLHVRVTPPSPGKYRMIGQVMSGSQLLKRIRLDVNVTGDRT